MKPFRPIEHLGLKLLMVLQHSSSGHSATIHTDRKSFRVLLYTLQTVRKVDNGVASEKLTPERVENSKELCTVPAMSENTLIAGDAVSPRKGEAAPLATPSAEGERFSFAL
ncbi:hypothetical protein FH972_008951 [Carpinus fangiana]|uniref:Uncharacterized protein n=1 Tax=Carpinus fangiana TaxID=176857 RepID=A0A5N6R336_9ROSI|nr:hypothetical protein FH972_008951 [Carpinus fangiana]